MRVRRSEKGRDRGRSAGGVSITVESGLLAEGVEHLHLPHQPHLPLQLVEDPLPRELQADLGHRLVSEKAAVFCWLLLRAPTLPGE